jgi:hypothetical protein
MKDLTSPNYPILLDIFQPLVRPINREQKRLMIAEYDRIFPNLWAVENSFYIHVLCSDYDYQTIYAFHQKWWDGVIAHIKSTQKPTLWYIREKSFTRRFKGVTN